MTDQSSSQGWPDEWNRGGGYYPDDDPSRPATGGPSQPTTPIWAPGAQQTGPSQQPRPSQAGQAQTGPQPRAHQQGDYAQANYRQAEYEQRDYTRADYQQADFQQPSFEQPSFEQPSFQPAAPPARQGGEAKGFLGALFDFSFSSFVTTRIIKVLYVLILILTALSALIFTISAFRLNMTFGLLTLVIGDPLFIIIVMAFWRLVLETFIVVFRIADDVRAIRERDR